MAVLDIRGSHGSGKSWLVHTLLGYYKHEDIIENGVAIGHYIPTIDCAVVGRYDRVCGGCDGIKTAEEVCRRATVFSQRHKHVVMEGILVAHTYKRYAELATRLPDYAFVFLNTPLQTCIARVKARRKQKGNIKPFNPTNLERDWHTIWKKLRFRFKEEGFKTYVLDYKDPFPLLARLLDNEYYKVTRITRRIPAN